MELKNLLTTWKEYQKWLKEQGINSSNIQEKLPLFINQLKQNPEKFQQVQNILNNQNIISAAKEFNISDNDINKVKSIFGSTDSKFQSNGNLTKEQLEMLKKFKR